MSVLGVRARAGARAACAAFGDTAQPLALRVRKCATAMRWERGNAPIEHATHGNSSCKREAACAGRACCASPPLPPPPVVWKVGVHGKGPPARNCPPKLAPAPSNAHKQPYPPTPQKKIRARAKAAKKIRAPRPRALHTCMWTFQTARAARTAQAAGRWRNAHAAAAPALQKPLTKRRKRFRGLRARPLTARRCPTLCRHKRAYLRRRCPSTHLRLAPSPWLPFCAFPSHASQFAVCLRALCRQRDPTGLLRDAAAGSARGGGGTALRAAGTALRYGSQVRLLGTALRYCSAQHPRP